MSLLVKSTWGWGHLRHSYLCYALNSTSLVIVLEPELYRSKALAYVCTRGMRLEVRTGMGVNQNTSWVLFPTSIYFATWSILISKG